MINKVKKRIDHFFQISINNSTITKEVLAGIIVFFSIVYILPVNAGLLAFNESSLNGIEGTTFASIFVATAIGSALASFIMAFYGKSPIVLSAGMGMNVIIATTLSVSAGYTGDEVFAIIILTSIIYLIFSLTSIREKFIKIIPNNLKIAITVGLGFYIAFIGLKSAGIIVNNGYTLIGLVDFKDNPNALLGLLGIIIVFGLSFIKGKTKYFSVLIAMIVVALIGYILHLADVKGMPHWTMGQMGQISEVKNTFLIGFKGIGKVLLKVESYVIIFTLFLVSLFGSTATFVSVYQAIETDDLKIKKAMRADAIGGVVAGIIGTSTITPLIESSIGPKTGGRTGLTSFVVGLLFLSTLLIYPFFSIFTVEGGAYITSLALVFVGASMFSHLKDFNYQDKILTITSFITIIFMLLTGIANGIGIGFIFYTFLMLFSGRSKEVHLLMYLITFLFIINYLLQALLL